MSWDPALQAGTKDKKMQKKWVNLRKPYPGFWENELRGPKMQTPAREAIMGYYFINVDEESGWPDFADGKCREDRILCASITGQRQEKHLCGDDRVAG